MQIVKSYGIIMKVRFSRGSSFLHPAISTKKRKFLRAVRSSFLGLLTVLKILALGSYNEKKYL